MNKTDRQRTLDWLRLIRLPGLGPVGVGRLLDHFGRADEILAADAPRLAQVPGIRATLVRALQSFRQTIPEEPIVHQLNRLERMGATVLIRGERRYPALLATIHDPPPVLFVLGDPSHLQGKEAVAIVGSRRATPQGSSFAYLLARDLAAHHITTVSGLALGIDTAAHEGALMGRGPTIAVTATGLDVAYPPGNRDLKRRIVDFGCLITEAPLGTEAAPYLFPPRNRIISGLSQGVVVVEASLRSGSLITARLALEQGREVFAVPGSAALGDERTKGVNNLIRQGARLVEGVEDILEELSWSLSAVTFPARSPPLPPLSPPAGREDGEANLTTEDTNILTHLQDGPLLADELARKSRLTVASLSRILLQLELTGLVERLPGNRYGLLKIF